MHFVTMIHIKKIVNFRFLHFVARLFRFILNRATENLDHFADLRNEKYLSGSIAKENGISNPHHGSKMKLNKKPKLWRLKYIFERTARFLE
jgi:hypothetical protein